MRITIEIDEGSAVLATRPAVTGADADAGGPPAWLVEAMAGLPPQGLEAGVMFEGSPEAPQATEDGLDGGPAPEDAAG